MKFSPFLLAALGGSLLLAAQPARAQQPPAATPARTLYPDSPARANPKAIAPKRDPDFNDGVRGPRGALDWERTVALSPDGRRFVTRSADGRLRVWELASGRSEAELPADAIAAVFSPDSRLLACHFEKPADHPSGRRWRVFTAADGKSAGESILPPDPDDEDSDLVSFSPDSRLLAGFLGNGANVRAALWDAAAGGTPRAVQPIKELFGGIATVFSPDGKTLAAAGAGNGTVLMSVPDLKPLKTLASAGARLVSAAAFSPDGKLLAVGGDERRVVRSMNDTFPAASLYEVATGRLVADLKIPPVRSGRVRQILFANDGRALVTATDRSLQAWSSADGRLQALLPDGGYPAIVSPDGRTLAAAQFPDLACWDTVTWRLGVRIVNARAGYGTSTGPQGNVPLVLMPDGGVTLRGTSAAAWELPAGRLSVERTATQGRAVY